MIVVGIDENGLGPLLGPLTTTAVTIRFSSAYRAESFRDRGLALGLTDSKASAATRKMRFAESVSLALLARTLGRVPSHASELFGLLHLDGPLGLAAPCPDAATRALCHAHDRALPTYGGSLEEGDEALRPLEKGRSKLTVLRVRTVVSCAGVLNAQLDAGRNKLAVDLAAMERLALDAREAIGEPITALCGMVGGIRDVPKFASHLPRSSFEEIEASRSRLHYRLPEIGDLQFLVDADAEHLPVALASMVGKYLRELAMSRIVDFHLGHDPELPQPSGYHDPITKRFAQTTEPLRRRLSIAPDCFARRG